MLTFLIAIALLLVAVAGVYHLLRSMGQDGVEAAAPGSCRSGKCGVQHHKADEAPPTAQVINIDEIRRKNAPPDNQAQ